jgi:hypothetical protein
MLQFCGQMGFTELLETGEFVAPDALPNKANDKPI